ncbi:MAG: ATPase [Chloroflexi bacterium]|nr:MAG: ATPase [Chloroflexota bacterium]
MTNTPQKTVLCITSYEKGQEFIRECKRQGCDVILLTVTPLEHAKWPRESIDELYHMPDLSKVDEVIHGVSFLARTRLIDRIVALDDYDVWTAANLREHLRIPGMGDTTVRYFRDKLAMRLKAQEHGFPVPGFVHVLNYDRINQFMARVPPPWVLKPRFEASTIGITKIDTPDEFWSRLNTLGDKQSFYLLERYIPGDVYHVDSLVVDRQVVFTEAHQYGRPPLDVFHEGGISTTRTLPRGSEDELTLKGLSRQILDAFGLVQGVAHMEFIKGRDEGHFYFLETAARVGGANIVELIEGATGINLWREWAKIETAPGPGAYQLPEPQQNYAGVIITLARQEYPDTTAYQEPEIVWRLNKRYHVGFVVAAQDPDRVKFLLDQYTPRVANDFSATAPPLESRPPSSDT